MSRTYTSREFALRTTEIARSAIKIAHEMIEQGNDYQAIRAFMQPCEEARCFLNTISYRANNDSRQAIIAGLRMAADFLETHKDPRFDIEDAWIAEVLVKSMMDRYYNAIPYRGPAPIALDGYISFYEAAADAIDAQVAEGLTGVAKLSSGKFHKEWINRPIRENEELPKDVYRTCWDVDELHRLAEAAFNADQRKRKEAEAE